MLGVGLVWCQRWRTLAGIGMLLGAVVRYARRIGPARPVLRNHTIRDARIPTALDGFRIAQISDVHLGQPFSDAILRWSVAQVRAEAPDLVVITGDIVNDRPALSRVSHVLQALTAPAGVYAIPGNHDYVEEIDDVAAALAFCGIRLLRNEGVLIQQRGGAVWLAGVDDRWHGECDIAAALAAAPVGVPVVLLAHAPDDVIDAAAHAAIVLQLSGHVHGGHIRLPAVGPLAMPRYGRRYTHGRYQVGAVSLLVSLGLGGRQARIGNPPELNIITLATERVPHEH